MLAQVKVATRLQQSRVNARRAFGFEGKNGELYEQTFNTCELVGALVGGVACVKYNKTIAYPESALTVMGFAMGATVGNIISVLIFKLIPHVHPLTFPVLVVAGIVYTNGCNKKV